jgi:hypothetical protein
MLNDLQTREYSHLDVISYPSGDRAFFVYEPLTFRLVEELQQWRVNRLVIRTYKKWQIKDLSNLNKFITSLYVEDQNTPVDIINNLTNLEELYLSHVFNEVDFSSFPYLRECFLNKLKVLPKSMKSCTQLKILKLANSKIKSFSNLANYKSLEDLELNCIGSDNLTSINLLPNLQVLSINRSQAQNLSFLENCIYLKSLNLSLFPKLNDLNGLTNLLDLKILHLESFSILEDIEPITFLHQLESLALVSCPKIKSVKPLLKLKKLIFLYLWEKTKIYDGDIRCILALPNLKELSFLNRRNYNLKIEEVSSILGLQ